MKRPLRIALNAFEGNSAQRGTDSYCSNLISGLATVDLENEYIVFTNHEAKYRQLVNDARNFSFFDPGIEGDDIVTVGSKLTIRGVSPDVFWLNTGLLPALTKAHIDIFHSTSYIGPFLQRGKRDFKMVATVHGLEHEMVPALFNPILVNSLQKTMPKTCALADRIIAVSSDVSRLLQKLYRIPQGKIETVLHGIDTRVFNTVTRNAIAMGRRTKPYFLFVGALEKRKNLDTALNAFSLFRRDNDADMIVVGDGNRDHFETMLAETKILDCVFFLKETNNPYELADLYRGAQALLCPSHYEGFGLVAAEAMMCGTPVIASVLPALPEVIGHGGIVVDIRDAGEMAHAMERVLREADLRNSLAESAIIQSQRYTKERMALDTIGVYRSMLPGSLK